MTTGMSAPPMDHVMCAPRPNDAAVTPARREQFVAMSPSPKRNMPPATTQAPKPPRLIRLLPGSWRGSESRRPRSFPKAMREPVKVTPPMRTPDQTEHMPTMFMGCAMYDDTHVITAARPTKEWKQATSSGREVMATRVAMRAPMPPPTPIMRPIWPRRAPVASSMPRVETMPPPIPIMPKVLPTRDVLGLDRPAMARMQHSAEPR
mmetsp:Transcript_30698/g.72136  ORF Transcript_30698/g.72136 Transcript_30698/m.72136 type:complete len:206 (-) Transcript_30698:1521-2138(-)